MKYGSVCSGVESASLAWESLGFEPQWFSEIDAFPSAVLKYHYPNVPNLGDMTKLREKKEYNDRSIDILVGGTPCQSFSIAGLRGGLDDERGNLAREFCRILDEKQPSWFIWENVSGVLSSDGGGDFASILSGFRAVGYSCAYRILDAQFFGVPQRRRRVFVVGHLGDWRAPTAVLFEPPSVSGNLKSRRQKKKRSSSAAQESSGDERRQTYRMTAFGEYEPDETAGTIKARDYKDPTDLICVHGTQDPDILRNKAHTLGRNSGQENSLCYSIQGNIIDRQPQHGGNGVGYSEEISGTLTTKDRHAVCFENSRRDGIRVHGDTSPTLQAFMGTGGGNVPLISEEEPEEWILRRFSPIECERLMGFPDNWTRIPQATFESAPTTKHFSLNRDQYDKQPDGSWIKYYPDSPRYQACGNSMAVPVMHWLGRRIKLYEEIQKRIS